ncbi:MAG TPA: hydroxymethylbilane synthase [Nitrospirales bacterium]|nr:hydroxymethylbilane synthase [Nitrospira sp. MA-1]HNP62009.1 hydroxymethylbilane synthase [Nitrospirales bacterium]
MNQTDSRARSTLIVGTRGSQLAIWQAEWVQRQLKALAPDISVILKRIQTSGDKIQDVPLAKIGGKGLFVKEIEEALLRQDIDLAVHSMKDVPSELPEGLEIVCVPEREDPRDALIAHEGHILATLPVGARVGTSSLRRQAQLLHARPDLEIAMLRGNVDTRLRKVREGHYDAIILAASGLKRLGWDQEVTEYLSVDVSVPAIGQGSLGLEGRKDDIWVRDLVGQFEHRSTRIAVTAERALLAGLEGGCQVPIAGYATIHGDTLTLVGLVASLDGKRYIRQVLSGPNGEAASIGTRVAEQLLDGGAKPILQEIYGMA